MEKELHGHPNLAAARRGVHKTAIRLLRDRGFIPYDISSSRRSEKFGTSGYHGWFTPRDLYYPELNKPVEDETAFILIDVDYYLDMNILATHMKPMVLWSFCPMQTTGSTEESTWRVMGDEYLFTVSGGTTYRHKAWEYGRGDYVYFERYGLKYVYTIDRFQEPGGTHVLILLQPVYSSVFTPQAHKVVRKNFSKQLTYCGDSVVITDRAFHFELKSTLYDTVQDRMQAKIGKFQRHSLLEFIKGHSVDVSMGDPSYLASWLFDHFGAVMEYTGLTYASVYRKNGEIVDNELVDRNKRMAPSPTNVEAMNPTDAASSAAGAIHSRITTVKNEVVPPPLYLSYAMEFIEEIMWRHFEGGSKVPMDWDAFEQLIERKQTLAKIRAVAEDPFSEQTPEEVFVKAFVKSESYREPKDERNISPTQDEHLARLSRFTYSAKQHLKESMWYMPGKTPKELARCVTMACDSVYEIVETDYSRFDGTISPWLRDNVEKRFYARTFGEESEVVTLIDNEIRHVRTTSGVGAYNTNGSRLSGSPLTTDGNTIINAYVQYCAYRNLGMAVGDAYCNIGLCYGDDGIASGAGIGKALEEASSALGLSLKSCVSCTVERPYVSFLGRVFPKAGESLTSFQDPTRVWPKIHLTAKKTEPEEKQNFAGKLASFVITDGKTPLLGQYCRKMLGFTPEGKKLLKSVTPFTLFSRLSDQWLFKECRAKVAESWPQDDCDENTEYLYAQLLGVSVQDLRTACDIVTRATFSGDLAGILEVPEVDPPNKFVLPNVFSEPSSIEYDSGLTDGNGPSKRKKKRKNAQRCAAGAAP